MDFKAIVDPKARSATACAVIGIHEGGELGAAAAALDGKLGGPIARLQAAGDFAARPGDSLLLPASAGARVQQVLLVGLGAKTGFGSKQYRKAVAAGAQGMFEVSGRAQRRKASIHRSPWR